MNAGPRSQPIAATFVIAAIGAALVAMVYEANPKIGVPLLILVVLALLFATFRAGSLAAPSLAQRAGGFIFGGLSPQGANTP